MDVGLDSLGAVELKNTIASRTGLELPVTASFDYPSAAGLAGFLASVASSLSSPSRSRVSYPARTFGRRKRRPNE